MLFRVACSSVAANIMIAGGVPFCSDVFLSIVTYHRYCNIVDECAQLVDGWQWLFNVCCKRVACSSVAAVIMLAGGVPFFTDVFLHTVTYLKYCNVLDECAQLVDGLQ